MDDECSLLESPSGEWSLEFEDDEECSRVVAGRRPAPLPRARGPRRPGRAPHITTAGPGCGLVVVVIELPVVSVE